MAAAAAAAVVRALQPVEASYVRRLGIARAWVASHITRWGTDMLGRATQPKRLGAMTIAEPMHGNVPTLHT